MKTFSILVNKIGSENKYWDKYYYFFHGNLYVFYYYIDKYYKMYDSILHIIGPKLNLSTSG